LASLLKSSLYQNNNLRLFRIISFQFQNTPVISNRTWDACEMNPKYPPRLNFFYSVSYFFIKVKIARFKLQGFIFFCPDSNSLGDFSTSQSPEIDVSVREIYGYLDKGLNA